MTKWQLETYEDKISRFTKVLVQPSLLLLLVQLILRHLYHHNQHQQQ